MRATPILPLAMLQDYSFADLFARSQSLRGAKRCKRLKVLMTFFGKAPSFDLEILGVPCANILPISRYIRWGDLAPPVPSPLIIIYLRYVIFVTKLMRRFNFDNSMSSLKLLLKEFFNDSLCINTSYSKIYFSFMQNNIKIIKES